MDERAPSERNERAENAITDGFLKHLADNSDSDVLRELGREVLHGNVSLTDAVTFSTYADALEPKLTEFTQWYQGLSEEQRRKEAAACAAEVEKLEAKLAAEDDARSSPHESRNESASVPGWQPYRRPE